MKLVLKLKLQMMPCDEKLKISYCDVRILDCLLVKRLSMRNLKKVMAYMLFVCLNMAQDQNLRSTQGCLLLNDNDKLLKDVTLDPIKPIHKNIILSFCHISRCLDFKITH